MASLVVATWNVLHRIHADNWTEPAIDAHPDEAARITAIAAHVAALPVDLVCLQEVSGDQLAALRVAVPATAQMFSAVYPRVPQVRRPPRTLTPGANLADPTEHLVTIVVRDVPARQVGAAAFPTDGGKGYLAVEIEDLLVIDTHVTYGDPGIAQCGQLAVLARAHAGPSVVLGDFNADRARILAALGPDFVAIVPAAPTLPTRPTSADGSSGVEIDHVIVRDTTGRDARVVSSGGLSDHNIVIATVT